MNKVSDVKDWIEIQLLDCQNLARQHGFAELAQAIDETLDLLDDPISFERLEAGRVLPFRKRKADQSAYKLRKP